MTLLDVRNLAVAYGEVQVVWGASLSVEEGSITALIGSNGAGKTTTLKTIVGLKRPREGEIHFAGERIDQLPSHRIVEHGISMVLEGGRPFPHMSVIENLLMGAYTRAARGRTGEHLERVFRLFPILQERRNQLAGTLSGGERQMLAIGRALMSDPKLLMLDEPSLGLAPKVVEQTFQVILELNRQGVTILLVEQNVQHTLQVAHRSFVLETGRVVLSGGPELRENEHVRTAYLGMATR
ncbi:MAG: ABC transporter ATP-binding protein [Deltaproteobacteria bacterium]|nr:ABC transporter ATP-binding protein [Deltaproteobacteria bacterium]